jgi:hypothetical protein
MEAAHVEATAATSGRGPGLNCSNNKAALVGGSRYSRQPSDGRAPAASCSPRPCTVAAAAAVPRAAAAVAPAVSGLAAAADGMLRILLYLLTPPAATGVAMWQQPGGHVSRSSSVLLNVTLNLAEHLAEACVSSGPGVVGALGVARAA